MEKEFFGGIIGGAVGGILISSLKLVIPVNVHGQTEPLILLVGRVFGLVGLVESILILLALCCILGVFFTLVFRPFIRSLPHTRHFTPAFIGALYGSLIWFFAGILITPAVTGVLPPSFAVGDLICWLLYGWVVALTHEAKRTSFSSQSVYRQS